MHKIMNCVSSTTKVLQIQREKIILSLGDVSNDTNLALLTVVVMRKIFVIRLVKRCIIELVLLIILKKQREVGGKNVLEEILLEFV